MRVYADGVFDLFHHGHAAHLEKAKKLFGPATYLIVGVCRDADVAKHKGAAPTLTAEERAAVLRHVRWVDQVIVNAPWVPTEGFYKKHDIDKVVHDDGAYVVGDDGEDPFALPKSLGMFEAIPRTPGISSTDIKARIASSSVGVGEGEGEGQGLAGAPTSPDARRRRPPRKARAPRGQPPSAASCVASSAEGGPPSPPPEGEAEGASPPRNPAGEASPAAAAAAAEREAAASPTEEGATLPRAPRSRTRPASGSRPRGAKKEKSREAAAAAAAAAAAVAATTAAATAGSSGQGVDARTPVPSPAA